ARRRLAGRRAAPARRPDRGAGRDQRPARPHRRHRRAPPGGAAHRAHRPGAGHAAADRDPRLRARRQPARPGPERQPGPARAALRRAHQGVLHHGRRAARRRRRRERGVRHRLPRHRDRRRRGHLRGLRGHQPVRRAPGRAGRARPAGHRPARRAEPRGPERWGPAAGAAVDHRSPRHVHDPNPAGGQPRAAGAALRERPPAALPGLLGGGAGPARDARAPRHRGGGRPRLAPPAAHRPSHAGGGGLVSGARLPWGLLRSYGPLAAAAGAFLLMAAAVPPVERAHQAYAGQVEVPSFTVGDATGTATHDEVAGDAPGAEEGASPSGEGGGAAAAGGDGGGGDGGGGANAGVAPCPDRTHQVPGDPYSPPCYAFFGDNGGATHQGVTADEIVVAVRLLEGPTAAEIFADISGESVQDSPEAYRDTVVTLAEYFSDRFQMYGR